MPVGTAIGAAVGGWGTQHIGWRQTFYLVGFPGLVLALLVRATVIEPPRGYADFGGHAPAKAKAPPVSEVLSFMFGRPSFLHLSLAAALHSVVWYASGAFNNAFFQRSHAMNAAQAGYWISFFSAVGGVGTFVGGYLADRLSKSTGDRRWYLWVPGVATFLCVPFQFFAYLSPNMSSVLPMFGGDDVHGGRVFWSVVRDDASHLAAAHALGCDVTAPARADADRPGYRSVARGIHQRQAAAVDGRRLTALLARHRRPREHLGGGALLHWRALTAPGPRRDGAVIRVATAAAFVAMLLTARSGAAQANPSAGQARQWRQQHEKAILDEFVALLAIPNVSRDRANIQKNAEFIAAMMRQRGIASKLVTVEGANPVVFGEVATPGATRTIVFYAHYDGQPLDPKEWKTPPFTPTLKDGRIYARSAGDDKAPIMALMAAVDAIRAAETAAEIEHQIRVRRRGRGRFD